MRRLDEQDGDQNESAEYRRARTALLAQRWLGSAATGGCDESIALEYLARTLDMPVHCPHDALGDALTTAQVFLALVSRLESIHGPMTVRALT